jgi:hypothetical protein
MKKIILPVVAIIMVLFSNGYLYSQEKVILKELPLRSQFFCGYCHVLTYPKVMKKAYESWKVDKHKEVPCAECHYPPVKAAIPEHEKIPTAEEAALKKKTEFEFMKTELEALSRLMTILNMDESVVRTKPRIDDKSCTTAKCHPQNPNVKEGEYWTKKINFVESEREDKTKRIIPYIHKTHFDKEKLIEGQEMHCGTCHQHETEQKHFEVSKEKCFLCHFKNLALNEKRSTCSLCHEIPTKSLQKKEPEPGAKLITHQTIEKDKVPCYSCHYEIVQGKGVIKKENCFECHDYSDEIQKKAEDKKLMHTEHVAKQNANCFECHGSLQHKKIDFLEPGREVCSVCHPEHHIPQKILLAGPARGDVSETPSLMYDVRTGCQGCHMEERIVKGEKVLHGDAKTCAQCHVEKTAGMVKEWKDSIAKALNEAKELEKEANEAIEMTKTKLPKEKLEKAMAMFKEGQENMQVVEAGGGVHNQKYSIQLLDSAMSRFEDAIDLVKE